MNLCRVFSLFFAIVSPSIPILTMFDGKYSAICSTVSVIMPGYIGISLLYVSVFTDGTAKLILAPCGLQYPLSDDPSIICPKLGGPATKRMNCHLNRRYPTSHIEDE